ncbi:hypothetical protein V8E51_011378 [Hyaloscypha variabilis]
MRSTQAPRIPPALAFAALASFLHIPLVRADIFCFFGWSLFLSLALCPVPYSFWPATFLLYTLTQTKNR